MLAGLGLARLYIHGFMTMGGSWPTINFDIHAYFAVGAYGIGVGGHVIVTGWFGIRNGKFHAEFEGQGGGTIGLGSIMGFGTETTFRFGFEGTIAVSYTHLRAHET